MSCMVTDRDKLLSQDRAHCIVGLLPQVQSSTPKDIVHGLFKEQEKLN